MEPIYSEEQQALIKQLDELRQHEIDLIVSDFKKEWSNIQPPPEEIERLRRKIHQAAESLIPFYKKIHPIGYKLDNEEARLFRKSTDQKVNSDRGEV